MSVVIHEFGHLLDIDYLDGSQTARIQSKMAALAARERLEWPSALVKRDISEYANNSHLELVAEAFTDVMLNGGSASVASRAIMEIITEEYEKVGGL